MGRHSLLGLQGPGIRGLAAIHNQEHVKIWLNIWPKYTENKNNTEHFNTFIHKCCRICCSLSFWTSVAPHAACPGCGQCSFLLRGSWRRSKSPTWQVGSVWPHNSTGSPFHGLVSQWSIFTFSVHPTYSKQSIWNLMNLMACCRQTITTQMTSPLGQVAMHANDIVATQDHGSEPATTPKTPKIPKIIAVIAATAWCLMFTCVSWCLLMLVVVWLYDYMAIGYMYSKLVHGFQTGPFRILHVTKLRSAHDSLELTKTWLRGLTSLIKTDEFCDSLHQAKKHRE